MQTGGGAGSSDNLGNGPVNGGASSGSGGGGGSFGAGAIAGIVVGVIAAIALGSALTWFLLRRAHRKRDSGVSGAEETSPPLYDHKYVYSGHPQAPAEMHSPSQEQKPRVVPVASELAAHQHFYAELPSEQGHR